MLKNSGHQRAYALATGACVGAKQLFNPGSVGMPYNGDPRAQYLLLDGDGDGWQPTFRQVEYDRGLVREAFDRLGLFQAYGPLGPLYWQTIATGYPWVSDFQVWMRDQAPIVREDLDHAVELYLSVHGPGKWAFSPFEMSPILAINAKGVRMIRRLGESDRASVTALLSAAPQLNLYLLGNLEANGFDADFCEFFGDVVDGRVRGVVNRYMTGWTVYGEADADLGGLGEVVDSYPTVAERLQDNPGGIASFLPYLQRYVASSLTEDNLMAIASRMACNLRLPVLALWYAKPRWMIWLV